MNTCNYTFEKVLKKNRELKDFLSLNHGHINFSKGFIQKHPIAYINIYVDFDSKAIAIEKANKSKESFKVSRQNAMAIGLFGAINGRYYFKEIKNNLFIFTYEL